jgi:hypothetical protein
MLLRDGAAVAGGGTPAVPLAAAVALISPMA